jgi:hypothetical protein
LNKVPSFWGPEGACFAAEPDEDDDEDDDEEEEVGAALDGEAETAGEEANVAENLES